MSDEWIEVIVSPWCEQSARCARVDLGKLQLVLVDRELCIGYEGEEPKHLHQSRITSIEFTRRAVLIETSDHHLFLLPKDELTRMFVAMDDESRETALLIFKYL